MEPDLDHAGVQAAARTLHDLFDPTGKFGGFDRFRTEWEKDVTEILRAYREASGRCDVRKETNV